MCSDELAYSPSPGYVFAFFCALNVDHCCLLQAVLTFRRFRTVCPQGLTDTMSGDQQIRLMASQFAEKALLYPKIEKLDRNVLASQ